MDVSDGVYTIFTAEIESVRTPVISVPQQELRVGELETGERYRIAVLPPLNQPESSRVSGGPQNYSQRSEGPPVEVGETVDVEIEDMGDQGDGLARIGPGYVIFVPETRVGDQVTIEIKEARENFAFGEVNEREP